MPLYEFECRICGHIYEELQEKISNEKIQYSLCPKCDGMAKRIMSPYSFIVNGYNAKNHYSKKS